MSDLKCRSCGASVRLTFADLGLSPISNAFVEASAARQGEMYYPLKACVCDKCWLVQLDSGLDANAHFHNDYVYFSSFSESWLDHARRYVTAIRERLGLGPESFVVEVASNDGYLLQYFVKDGIPCLGIEPTGNTAAAARQKGVETMEAFFGLETARQLAEAGRMADLVLGNNVLAHVPDINDFVSGLTALLKPEGVITLEFPHLARLMEENQFDTIYHEHYYYLSMIALRPVFARAKLRIFDVEHLSTHGGSLRIFVCHHDAPYQERPVVQDVIGDEHKRGLSATQTYSDFATGVRRTKSEFVAFLTEARNEGKRIAAYGAAAKGNTLLNYCGLSSDVIAMVADRNPTKQGRLLPGSRIPVVTPEQVLAYKPDYLVILPWNLRSEIMKQMAGIRDWGGQFVVATPKLEVLP